jgi:hypothetical protein
VIVIGGKMWADIDDGELFGILFKVTKKMIAGQ